MSFFTEYNKLNPEPAAPPAAVPAGMNNDEIKAYVNAAIEGAMNDVKDLIQKSFQQASPTDPVVTDTSNQGNTNIIEGGNDNASSTDLSNSQPDS